MNFQIIKIILWPKNHKFSKREVVFEKSKVNIISGISKTGKSSVIPIIDYCLGARKCRIPADIIRNYCEWFGVLVETSDGQKLFARTSPKTGNINTDKMYILESTTIEIPPEIPKENSTVENCKRILNRLTQLTNANISNNEESHNRASARDTIAFNFQPQHIVANPTILFYKTEEISHRLKLSRIFPYLICAINEDTIILEEKLKKLDNDLNLKIRELRKIQSLIEKWDIEIRAKLLQANELNLVHDIKDNISTKEILDLLEKVVNTKVEDQTFNTTSIQELANEIASLRKRQNEVSIRLYELKQKRSNLKHLKSNISEFSEDLTLQKDRLQITDFLANSYKEDKLCPICNSPLIHETEELQVLLSTLEDLKTTKISLSHVSETFDKESNNIEQDLNATISELNQIDKTILNLQQEDSNLREQYYSRENAFRFIGNLEKLLEFYQEMQIDSELSQEIISLKEEISDIRSQLDTQNNKKLLDEKVKLIGSKISYWLKYLDVEKTYVNAPLTLNLNQLSIQVTTNITDSYLWEIGSGSNHLAFHIATFLGLHDYLITSKCNHILNFLVFDQPSQVYFPKTNENEQFESEGTIEFSDDDKRAVHKTIKTLVDFSTQFHMQIIVLDHAAEDVWGDIDNCHLVEDWRMKNDGTFPKLVPQKWIDDAQND